MSTLGRESLVYSAGAATAFAADFLVLGLLVEVFGWQYLLAATLSFLVGTVVVYWVSVRHAFAVRRVTDRRAEFGYFATIGGIGVLLNLALMYVLVDLAGIHYLWAKVVSAGFTFVTNFSLRRWFLFSPR
jgi:putative flippase GtrA